MATCSSADSVLDAASQIKSNATKLDTFVNGTASQTVQLGTGDPTPTLRKFVADAQDVVTQAALDAGQTVLDDVAQNTADIEALQSVKADKVEDAVEGNFAGLDDSGNLTDSGRSPADITALEEEAERLDSVKADKFVPADVGNLAKLSSDGNLRDAGRAVEDFVPLLAYANGEAHDLALLNRMNIEFFDEWYAKGAAHLTTAKIDAMKVAQGIGGLIDAFDDSASKHRLQVRLFDGSNPSASSKPVLFVISGQSNAVGCGLYPPCTQAKDSGSFWSWANGDNELKPIVDPISNENKGSGWPEFARLFFELTGRKTILLNIANGGSTVTDGGYTTANTWADNGYGTLRTSRSGVWNAFSSAVPATDYDLGGILWVQGEYDAQRLYAGTITVGEYSGTWSNLSEGTRGVLQWTRNLIGASSCPIFIGLIGYQQSCKTNTALKNAYDAIINAQLALVDYADIFPGFSMTPQFFDAWENYYSDTIHYNRKGYRLQGQAFARSVVNYLHL